MTALKDALEKMKDRRKQKKLGIVSEVIVEIKEAAEKVEEVIEEITKEAKGLFKKGKKK